MHTRWVVFTAAVVLSACCGASGCSAAPGPQAGTSTSVTTSPLPVTARLNQFRDNYSRQIIELQVSNVGPTALTVQGAAVKSGNFTGPIEWIAGPAGTEIPSGQTKSLPAQLPAPVCPGNGSPPRLDLTISGRDIPLDVPVDDPFGVLDRNNGEMCLAQDVAAIARLEFAPALEVGPDAGTAALRLLVVPQRAQGDFIIESFGGTPLLAESTAAPWPKNVHVSGTGSVAELLLVVRPGRCDPHAVAEDKVGTLIPIQVALNGRRGIVKVPAGQALRGHLRDFVSTTCTDSRLGS